MNVRLIETDDAAKIAQIYNYYVENTHYTFELAPVSIAEMERRIVEITRNFPFLVCEMNNEIVGYAYATQFKMREAYRHSVEVSVYVKNGEQGKGIGAALYERLFEILKQTSSHAIIAGISLPNEASIRLHENFGFEKVAHFREVGNKFNRWIDVGYWEKLNH